jgi:hypothetical protein
MRKLKLRKQKYYNSLRSENYSRRNERIQKALNPYPLAMMTKTKTRKALTLLL